MSGYSTAVVMHALPVGGGILALSPLPGAGGDYRGDLDHLASWRPAMVISIATQAELVDGGAQLLGQHIQDKGARWVHVAMPRGSGPTAVLETTWPDVSKQARRALLGGGRVLLHSPKGQGRCGMVALRLMIEAGEAPDEALDRLSAVCPETIGSEEQMAWAMRADRGAVTFVRHPVR